MLSIKFIRDNRDDVVASMIKRKGIDFPENIKNEIIEKFSKDYDSNSPEVLNFLIGKVSELTETPVDKIIKLDVRNREIIADLQTFQEKRNKLSKEIGIRKKAKEDCTAIINEVKEFSGKLAALEIEKNDCQKELNEILDWIPNIVNESIPVGGSEEYGSVIKEVGEKKKFEFTPLPHWELLEKKRLLHLGEGAKMSGSGFPVYSGEIAALERALASYMLDQHKASGYDEIAVPFLVNSKTMYGTGQLPKLKEDMYYVEKDDLYLIPTAEVPVTNFYSREILDEEMLPKKFVAFSPCFRREAGSYGKDTRGIFRVHQFNKVELVKLVLPENSWDELEDLLSSAEKILVDLELPYRVLTLASGDLSFAASKCYDIEVWSPGMGNYLEVSSCSNFVDFQARRSNIRFRRKSGGKPEFVHTLNGSALAMPRTLIAIVENYQREDGTIIVPEVLRKYMNTDIIE